MCKEPFGIMSNNDYKSIPELADLLQRKSRDLEIGSLSAAQFEVMINATRELYERLVVLRYKAFEEKVHGVKSPKRNTFRPTRIEETKESKAETARQTSFQLNFRQQAEMSAEEGIIPRNQVNLIDAIEQEEKHAPEPAEQGPEPTVASVAEVPASKEEKPIEHTPIEPTPVEEPVKEAVVEPAAEPVQPQEDEVEMEQLSLNDQMAEAKEETLASKLRRQPVKDLPQAIGINQKFLFMNDLFEGENDVYKDAVVKLNECSGLAEAKVLTGSLAEKYGWDWKSDSVKLFMDLVERRYL